MVVEAGRGVSLRGRIEARRARLCKPLHHEAERVAIAR